MAPAGFSVFVFVVRFNNFAFTVMLTPWDSFKVFESPARQKQVEEGTPIQICLPLVAGRRHGVA